MKAEDLPVLKEAADKMLEAGVPVEFEAYLLECFEEEPPTKEVLTTDGLAKFMANHLEGFLIYYVNGR